MKEIFNTHKTYANKRERISRPTTGLGGPRRRRPLHTRAREDEEEPRQFTRSDDRGDDDEALYEPANEDEELRRVAASHSRDEPLHNPRRQPLLVVAEAEETENLGQFATFEDAEDTNFAWE